MNIIAYYRVSTKKQETSGLGLLAQKKEIEIYSKKNNCTVIKEFTEIESGKSRDRTELAKAIIFARENNAQLIIAKLDRLARDVEFIFQLKNSQVDFKALDLPDMDTLTIGIYATIAQHEREIISKRIREALLAKKKRGEKLGNAQFFSNEGRSKGRLVQKQNALKNPSNRRAFALIKVLREQGKTFEEIAGKLNECGMRTVREKQFSRATVRRVMKMYSKN